MKNAQTHITTIVIEVKKPILTDQVQISPT